MHSMAFLLTIFPDFYFTHKETPFPFLGLFHGKNT